MVHGYSNTINNVIGSLGLKFKLFAAALAIAGMSLGALGTAHAGSPANSSAGKDINYSYVYQTLTDADGTTASNYHIAGSIDYTKSGNKYTARTVCAYGRGDSIASQVYVGQYSVPYAIADTSYEGVRQFCTNNFQYRTYP